MTATVMALAGAALASGASPPLPPTGQWLIEGQDNMCALSHPFGTGQTAVTLAIRPWPLAEMADVVVFTHDTASDVRSGKASLIVDAEAATTPAPYTAFALAKQERRETTFTVPAASIDRLAGANMVTVVMDGRARALQLPPTTATALVKLQECGALLLRHLGVDPATAARAAIPARPIGAPSAWFSSADYPTTAASGGAQGRSRLLLTIAADGRVSGCTTFGSTGNAQMDKAACQGFIKRGRYRPATDASGDAVVSYVQQSVHWVL